jgi:hypothetical protein
MDECECGDSSKHLILKLRFSDESLRDIQETLNQRVEPYMRWKSEFHKLMSTTAKPPLHDLQSRLTAANKMGVSFPEASTLRSFLKVATEWVKEAKLFIRYSYNFSDGGDVITGNGDNGGEKRSLRRSTDEGKSGTSAPNSVQHQQQHQQQQQQHKTLVDAQGVSKRGRSLSFTSPEMDALDKKIQDSTSFVDELESILKDTVNIPTFDTITSFLTRIRQTDGLLYAPIWDLLNDIKQDLEWIEKAQRNYLDKKNVSYNELEDMIFCRPGYYKENVLVSTGIDVSSYPAIGIVKKEKAAVLAALKKKRATGDR